MKWIWHMCFTNMKQRGVRTGLTILGVVIGVISIVSLLAIGIGVKNQLLSQVSSEGSITEITISGVSEGKRKDKMITDRKVSEIKELENVETVYPRLEVFTTITYGRFVGWTSITGVPEEYLEQMKIAKGEPPVADGYKPELLIGNHVMDQFFNEGTGISYTEINKDNKEKLNLSGENVQVKFGMEENAQDYRLPVCGMLKSESYRYDDYNIWCNMDVLKKYLKRIAVDGKIPDQPVDKNDENYSEWIYKSAIVKVKDVDSVDKTIKKLQDMGFQTENNKVYVDSLQRWTKIVQVLLGGIGMIALVVAVIGIGNTMTTSVYDRINEIGILKVLGCDPDELLSLFLLESGILGGLGGLIGIVLSYGITEIFINKLAVKWIHLQKGTELAVIPLWLAIAAFLFAILLGVAAGFFPAKWAAKLKPIDAVVK